MPGLAQQPHHAALAQLSQRSALPLVSQVAVYLAWLALVWSQRRRTRIHLDRLDTARLHDIGLTPHQARKECRKWFWRP